ncbi:MAG: GNAT family protein, partial [Bacteroidota bacterium]
LRSKRLGLVLIKWEDLDTIHQLHSFPQVDQFNTLGIPKDIEETKRTIAPWIEAHQATDISNFTFAIRLSKSNQLIGLLGLKLGSKKFKIGEIWYKLYPNQWGKGYATETVNAILDFAFNDLKLHRIEAGCAIQNIGSIKVLEKVGMTREGHRRKILPLKSGWSDNYMYAILETDERR